MREKLFLLKKQNKPEADDAIFQWVCPSAVRISSSYSPMAAMAASMPRAISSRFMDGAGAGLPTTCSGMNGTCIKPPRTPGYSLARV